MCVTGKAMDASPHRASLGEVLDRWAQLYDHAAAHGRIAPLHAFTERTHLGLLAAAAWQCGYEAFEEVAIAKGNGGLGRVDLILHLDDHPLIVEAKRTRPVIRSAPDVQNAFERILPDRLARARRDARRTLEGNRRRRRLSLVFFTPRLGEAASAHWGELSHAFAEEALRWAQYQRGADFLASWVPEADPGNAFFKTPADGWIPGVFLVGKMHSRAVADVAA